MAKMHCECGHAWPKDERLGYLKIGQTSYHVWECEKCGSLLIQTGANDKGEEELADYHPSSGASHDLSAAGGKAKP
jgi:hypothetical protein